jgi:membrane-bound lytic murein transglycosylase B
LSLTRTVTSAATLAALALVCGPVLESSGDGSAAQAAAAISAPEATGSTIDAPAAEPARWNGPLPIRPSRIAKVAPGTATDAPVIQAAVLGPPGATGALGIPLMVLRAYKESADQLAVEQPSCKLPWWLLAGIGHTESGHAESGRLTADGTTRGRILGPRLNGGIPGDAIITDTDKGHYDGDTVYDRAVGPMQFIPSTWVHWGADGNADGKLDPSNIFDATLAAGRYLCAHDRDLTTAAGLRAAVLSYNHSAPYLATVLAWGTAYRDGASAVPDSPLPVVSDVTKVRPPRSSRPPKPTTNPSKLPSPGQTPAPSSSPSGGSASATASPSETTSCPSTSPSPTQSESSSSAGEESTTTQSLTGSATAGSGSATAGTGSATGKASAASSSASRVQSATAQSFTAQSSTAQSSTGAPASDSATASPSASSCTP